MSKQRRVVIHAPKNSLTMTCSAFLSALQLFAFAQAAAAGRAGEGDAGGQEWDEGF
jgi:hypothetical protein